MSGGGQTPTRFLDFTRFPYVACLFALEELQKNADGQTEDCAIWAVDTSWLITNSFCRVAEDKELSVCEKDNFLNSALFGG